MTLKIDAKTFHLLSIDQDDTPLPLGQITPGGEQNQLQKETLSSV